MRKTTRLRPIFTFALLVAASGCGGPAQPPLDQAPLAGARIGGDFSLTDSGGKRVNWADFAGKWRVVYFGYTFCPDVCPLDMTVMMQGVQKYAEAQPTLAAKLRPVFITIDPERDTPVRLGEFAGSFRPRVIALTGSRAEIDAAAKAFAVYQARGESLPDGGYLMDHSRIAYLFDPSGKPVAILPVDKGMKDGPAAVAAELALWVR